MDEREPATKEEMLAKAFELLCAFDDIDLGERARLIGGQLVRLSYGAGFVSVIVNRQKDLGTLAGIADTHVARALEELRTANILQIHPEEDRYEILPDVADWKPRSRCRLGAAHARTLAADIVQEHRRRTSAQRELGELDQSFQPEPTLRQIIGENAREAAWGDPAELPLSSCPPGPGAADGLTHADPPGIKGQSTGTVAPKLSLREKVRRSLAGAVWQEPVAQTPEVTSRVTSPTQSRVETGPKVTPKVTLPTPTGANEGRKVTPEVTSRAGARARPSDDHLPSDHQSFCNQRQQRSSESDDHDGPADDRGGGGGMRQMTAMDDELLDDLRRFLGPEGMGSFTLDWREAIHTARPCVAEALASTKANARNINRHAGGYLKRCFLNECTRRGTKLRPGLFGGAPKLAPKGITP